MATADIGAVADGSDAAWDFASIPFAVAISGVVPVAVAAEVASATG